MSERIIGYRGIIIPPEAHPSAIPPDPHATITLPKPRQFSSPHRANVEKWLAAESKGLAKGSRVQLFEIVERELEVESTDVKVQGER